MVVLEAREVEVRGRAIFILRGDDRNKMVDKKTESGAGFLNEFWRMSRKLVMRKTVRKGRGYCR